MENILYGISGLAGGVLGGMGMGGGTILIPILSVFFGLDQQIAQGINLIGFIPMAIIALIIHLKNKLVDFKKVLFIVLPGIITCVLGCYIAKALDGDILKRCFGGFLILLSILQIIVQLKGKNQ